MIEGSPEVTGTDSFAFRPGRDICGCLSADDHLPDGSSPAVGAPQLPVRRDLHHRYRGQRLGSGLGRGADGVIPVPVKRIHAD